MIKFEGLFFNEKNINKLRSKDFNKLKVTNKDVHITLNRFSEKENKHLYGKKFKIKVIGYGNDGQNSGFLVQLPKELIAYYRNISEDGTPIPPHITTSMALGARAKDTRKIDFKPLIKKFFIEGYYSSNQEEDKKHSNQKKFKL